MLTLLTILLLIVISISVLKHVNAGAYKEYEKSFITIEINSGDTLTSIAEEYALSADQYIKYIDEVKSINNLNNDTIHSGCYLIVPIYE